MVFFSSGGRDLALAIGLVYKADLFLLSIHTAVISNFLPFAGFHTWVSDFPRKDLRLAHRVFDSGRFHCGTNGSFHSPCCRPWLNTLPNLFCLSLVTTISESGFDRLLQTIRR